MAAQGDEREPVFYEIAVNDNASALVSALGAVAALYARESLGEGQEVQTCLANQVVLCQSGEVVEYKDRPANPKGGVDCIGVTTFRRLYQCSDGWIAIACRDIGDASRLCEAIGHPNWTEDGEILLTGPRNSVLAAALADVISHWFRDRLLDRLAAHGVPAAPALTLAETFDAEYQRENGFYEVWNHPEFGEVTGIRTLGTWDGVNIGWDERSPLLGEHTVVVLREFGLPEERIDRLLADGVVRQA